MTRHRLALVVVTLMAVPGTIRAQDAKPAAEPQPGPQGSARPARPVIPLEVQVVIARYQGDKRISSLPYVLAVNTYGGPSQLNMAVDVAVPTTTFSPVASGDKPQSPLTSFSYRSVGTSISCDAGVLDDGRFELNLAVDESSVVPGPDVTEKSLPAFRSFRSRNRLLLKDGQTRQYTAASDRVTGETVRVEVTLRVVK